MTENYTLKCYIQHLAQGNFLQANDEIFIYLQKQKYYNNYVQMYNICKVSFNYGYINRELLVVYCKLIKKNPFYFKKEFITLFNRKKMFRYFRDLAFENIEWLSDISIFNINNKDYLDFIINILENKRDFTLSEYKITIKIVIDFALMNYSNISYKKILNSYCNDYQKFDLQIFLRSYS